MAQEIDVQGFINSPLFVVPETHLIAVFLGRGD